MIKDILLLLIGLAMILLGGNYVTNGAVTVARRMKISGLMVGLTIVAFGSSTPDLVVCLFSTISDKSQLALGDVVGAGIFDLLLAVGVTALISPIAISATNRTGNLPLLLLATMVLFFVADDRLIDGGLSDIVTRSDGLVMLCLFAIFITYTVRSSKAASPASAVVTQPLPSKGQMWIAAGEIVGGLAALFFGGRWIVDGASGIALKAGLSEGLVGLTIVAVGSSLPDLATSGMAALKRQTGIAVGNLIGATIFNIFFALGVCAVVRPLDSANITFIDYGTLVASALAITLIAAFYKRHVINRLAGGLLVAGYIAYIVYTVLAA